MVSVSTATTGPRVRPSGRSFRCRWMVPPGMNWVVLTVLVPRRRLELPRPCGHRYLKPARLPIPPPGQSDVPRRERESGRARDVTPARPDVNGLWALPLREWSGRGVPQIVTNKAYAPAITPIAPAPSASAVIRVTTATDASTM